MLAAEGQMLPFEPWDARPLTGAQRRADGRRHGRGQRLRPAPDPGRRLPRQHDRRALRRRHRGGGEERRPGDEERHRPRPREADGRQPRHARRPDRGRASRCCRGPRRSRRWCSRGSMPPPPAARCGRPWRRPTRSAAPRTCRPPRADRGRCCGSRGSPARSRTAPARSPRRSRRFGAARVEEGPGDWAGGARRARPSPGARARSGGSR